MATDARRRKMEQERRSMPEVAPQAIRDDTVVPRRAELLEQVLDEAVPAAPRQPGRPE